MSTVGTEGVVFAGGGGWGCGELVRVSARRGMGRTRLRSRSSVRWDRGR